MIMRSLIAALLLTPTVVGTQAIEEITFTVYEPAMGQEWREMGSIESESTYRVDIGGELQEESTSSLSEFETSFSITRVDGSELRELTVHYVLDRTTTQVRDGSGQLEVSALEGNTYLVGLSSGPPAVHRPDGTAPPQAEVDLVVDSLAHLAKPRRLSEYLASLGPVGVGATITLPPSIVRDAWSSDLFLAEEVILKLDRIIVSAGDSVGVFDAAMRLANPPGSPVSIDARVRGTMWVHGKGGRIIKSRLVGPIMLDGEWGDDPRIRIEGNGLVESAHEITEGPEASRR
jgi:hypothetical protein